MIWIILLLMKMQILWITIRQPIRISKIVLVKKFYLNKIKNKLFLDDILKPDDEEINNFLS